MFSFFRRGATAKVMLIFLGLALFAMVVTGFGTGGGGLGDVSGGGSATIASVEGEDIGAARVRDEAQRQLRRLRQEQPELDMAAFLARGSLTELVDQLVAMTATVMFGKEQGLAASKTMIDREIAGVPAFQNLAGQFDQATFERVLAQESITPQQLREEIEGQLIQRQLLLPLAASAHVPQGLAARYASLLLETRSGTVGAVPVEAMPAGSEPTDREVAAFFQQNRPRYTIPERRVIRYALLGPEAVAAQATATEQEIAAAYRQNQATYGAKETRTLSQVVLQDEAAARAFARKLSSGTSFAQAAQQAGFSASDIAVGEHSKESFARLSTAEVANAAFAGARGATAGPVRSELGWHLVRVEEVKTTPGRPLEAVRGELAQRIEEQKRQNALADLVARVEDSISDGATLEEVARAQGLELRETAPITATGASPDNAQYRVPPELQPALKTAFDMAPDEDPLVEPIDENRRFVAMNIARAVPAAPPPLGQIQARVKADLVARRASERARAVAQSIVAKINAGTPPTEAFAQAQVRLPAVQPINAVRRDIARQTGEVPPPLQMLFSLPRGKARLLPAPNGAGWFVVHLDKVVPGDSSKEPGLAEAVRGQFAQILGNEYVEQFTAAIRKRADVERNEKALDGLRRDLAGPGAQ